MYTSRNDDAWKLGLEPKVSRHWRKLLSDRAPRAHGRPSYSESRLTLRALVRMRKPFSAGRTNAVRASLWHCCCCVTVCYNNNEITSCVKLRRHSWRAINRTPRAARFNPARHVRIVSRAYLPILKRRRSFCGNDHFLFPFRRPARFPKCRFGPP